MDVRYINPFVDAVKNVFDTMLDLAVEVGAPTIKKNPVPDFDVSSIIGLSGPVSGCVAISLSKELALIMAGAMLDETFKELDDDCTDALGEFANMVIGNAKSEFPDQNAAISPPSVIVGRHKVAYPSKLPIISIPCKTADGQLVIDVAIKIEK